MRIFIAKLFVFILLITFFCSHSNQHAAEIVDAINQVLCGKLESDFVTAGYLFLYIEEKNMMYAGAGHMPLLLWRAAEQKIYEFREKGNPQKKRWIMI